MALDHYGAIDAIITNPPYSRGDADAQADRALPEHRADVAAAGRGLGVDHAGGAVPAATARTSWRSAGVKWIEGSKHTGKDNHAWYRFDVRHKAGPVIHRRDQGEAIAPSAHRSLRTMRQALPAAAIDIAVLLAGMQATGLSQEA